MYSQQLENKLSEKDQSTKNNDLIIEQYRLQLTNEKELRLSKARKIIQINFCILEVFFL